MIAKINETVHSIIVQSDWRFSISRYQAIIFHLTRKANGSCMSQQQHIGQWSTKYPRESAWPTKAEQEGLQATGEPPHALQQGSPVELTPSHCQRKRGRERRRGGAGSRRKDRRVPLPQGQVMVEALTGMPVQIQGEGDDASAVESQLRMGVGGGYAGVWQWHWELCCWHTLGQTVVVLCGSHHGITWCTSSAGKMWHFPHTELGVLRHTTTVVKGKVLKGPHDQSHPNLLLPLHAATLYYTLYIGSHSHC